MHDQRSARRFASGNVRRVKRKRGDQWYVQYRLPGVEVLWDEAAWSLVKAGKIRGYSMGGRALRVRVQAQPEHSVSKQSRPSWGQRLVAGQRIEFRSPPFRKLSGFSLRVIKPRRVASRLR